MTPMPKLPADCPCPTTTISLFSMICQQKSWPDLCFVPPQIVHLPPQGDVAIVALRTMSIRPLALALLMALSLAPAAWADVRGQAREQVEFGIQVAQRGLWKEAIYRWERAAQID